MKNYISFSLYGNNELYSCGAIENARLAKDLYPNWQVVFFVGESIHPSTLTALEKFDVKIVLRPGPESPNSMFWRFEAVNLPDAQRVIIRDADSRISPREVASVLEWAASGKSLHVIRDHPWHSQDILGGMWGVQGLHGLQIVAQSLPANMNAQGIYGDDQEFLSKVIYPKFKGDVLAHDSFYKFTKGSRPLGPRENGAFIGEVIECSGEFDSSLRAAISRYEKNPPLKWLLRLTRVKDRLVKLTSRALHRNHIDG